MLLFIGEITHCSKPHGLGPPTCNIENASWNTTKSGAVLIHYCDFSRRQDRLVMTDGFAIGMSGNPVIPGLTKLSSSNLEKIGQELLEGNAHHLETANGVFCGFHLANRPADVRLFTDYLGFRKIFLYRSAECTVFTNAQWLIEQALGSRAPFDSQALVEIGVLGHPLAHRTRLQDVTLLEPGQILTLRPDGTSKTQSIARLTATAPAHMTEADALDALHTTWKQAVEDRIGTVPHQHAFLSGGMDSRLLVHTLKECGGLPRTANFAPPKTRDRVFAEMTAHSMDVPLWLHPSGGLNINLVTDTVKTWIAEDESRSDFLSESKIWSGDGGSVGLGHVYLDDELTRLAEAGKFIDSARHFCTLNKRKPVVRAYRDPAVEHHFNQRIAHLLESYSSVQPARAPFYFLMLNDQRHHLNRHYENFHKRGFDFELPFFDRRLIELVASLPGEWFNEHRMYDQMFHKIGGSIIQTPWQTYPGHVICPLPYPAELSSQWSDSFHSTADLQQKRRSDAWQCLKFSLTPSRRQRIFSKGYVCMASILTLMGATDRSYLYQCIEAARP